MKSYTIILSRYKLIDHKSMLTVVRLAGHATHLQANRNIYFFVCLSWQRQRDLAVCNHFFTQWISDNLHCRKSCLGL